MTTVAHDGTQRQGGPEIHRGPAPRGTAESMERCHRAARQEGLAPALDALARAVLPGLLPCGPSGHAVVAGRTYARAAAVWVDGVRQPRRPGQETTQAEFDLPGGPVVAARVPLPEPADADHEQRAAYALGLVWLRLGLSEALRAACLAYLARRRSGDSTVLQQQLVKGTIADVLVEHLEIRAVLTAAEPGDLPLAMLHHLQRRITAADREQVRLLGASGYLTDSPGMTAYVSELLAEVYAAGEEDA
ncbi:hypothetical protein ACIBAI_08095 [Streptomyces sp. NPDC051041]|uniref:hypothetical protein n=1 Tax=Streptomyces sp. NPDC051041 TaxID=3365640 RepID=UPI00378DE5F9